MATLVLLTLAISRLILTVGLPTQPFKAQIGSRLSFDPLDLEMASLDFGGMALVEPLAVFHPSSAEDVARLVRTAYESARGFTVSAKGNGHSINGQAQTSNGVVIEMSGSGGNRLGWGKPAGPRVSQKLMFVDVWGGELWINVLKSTLKYGLAPKSWTDYLYLSVGGKGEVLTCSEEQNTELYHAVLGGLGQFGIITRARIALEPAPQRVKWIRVLYSNFSAFTQDQEYLISLNGQKFDYVEGFVIVDDEGEVEGMLKKLGYLPASEFISDVPYLEFLDRVHKEELKLRSMNLWEVPHPWLNLFVPKSRIADFDKGVIKGILGNKSSGPILIYPMNRNKWDEKSSVMIPKEEVFYLVALLRSALDNGEETQSLEYLKNQNSRILRFCENERIKIKQYLPHYTTQQQWMDHFEEKWSRIYHMKMEFDPRHILATGQQIFVSKYGG
ncbi:hypothetical protein LguiB_017175 [Lonicera macranthoides]